MDIRRYDGELDRAAAA